MAKPDLSAGMVKKGVYQQVGHDVDTGLPVMKRRDPERKMAAGVSDGDANNDSASGSSQPTAKTGEPKPKEAPQSKPDEKATPVDQPETKPKADLKPAGPAKFAKNQPVRMADGTTGRVAYSDDNMKVARVKTDDGKSVNVQHHKLMPMNEVKVKAHVRMVPARNEQ